MSFRDKVTPGCWDMVWRGDYSNLTKTAGRPTEVWDGYWRSRAALIVGNDRMFDVHLSELFAVPGVHPSKRRGIREFLVSQKHAIERVGQPEAVSYLTHAPICLTDFDEREKMLLMAEKDFLTGFFLNEQDQYAKAVPYHEKAIAAYRNLGLTAALCTALSNWCTAQRRLGNTRLVREGIDQMRQLAEKWQLPVFWYRYRAQKVFSLRSEENWTAVAGEIKELFKESLRLGRYRDAGSFGNSAAHALLKNNDSAGLSELLDQLVPWKQQIGNLARISLHAYQEFASAGWITEDKATSWIRKWQRRGVEGVHLIGLIDLLCQRLEQAGAWNSLLTTVAHAKRLSLEFQQGQSLVDFRPYEAAALAALGQKERAALVLELYRRDGEEHHSIFREERIARVQQLLTGDTDQRLGKYMVLHLDRDEIEFRGEMTPLGSRPTVVALLRTLIKAGRPVPVHIAFRQIYGQDFHPITHEKRLSSLLERTRQILGGPEFVVRTGGTLKLSPMVTAELRGDSHSSSSSQRRERIMEFICSRGIEVAIGDLEVHFSESRRTLQLDLNRMVRSGLLSTTGVTKKRRYQAAAFSEQNHPQQMSESRVSMA